MWIVVFQKLAPQSFSLLVTVDELTFAILWLKHFFSVNLCSVFIFLQKVLQIFTLVNSILFQRGAKKSADSDDSDSNLDDSMPAVPRATTARGGRKPVKYFSDSGDSD